MKWLQLFLKKKKKEYYQAARLLVKPQSVAVVDSA